jgi:hydroxymethylbilane synthase
MNFPAKPLILGTRGSDLALAQSKMAREALLAAHPGLIIELKIITTTGDARTAMPLHEPTAEGAGLFTKQLEEALLSGEIDIAVHSLKDLPVETPTGLLLAAILPRAPIDDLLISRHTRGLANLPSGAVVGTSSPRRALLLQRRRPDLKLVPIRGNVPTRLSKVASSGAYDATLLAAAGLRRLGHDLSTGELLVDGLPLAFETLEWMLPAPGQGAIAVETRIGDRSVALLHSLHDQKTAQCVEAERLVLKHLGGGCHLALGALATEAKGAISLQALFIPDPEGPTLAAEATASTPTEAARLVADQLLLQVSSSSQASKLPQPSK